MISIRKLAAVDMVAHGTRVTLIEFALGIVVPLILGILSLRAGSVGRLVIGWEILLGVWLVGIALNYIPLFIYAVVIARGKTVQEEGQPELAHARRYGIQQLMLIVPALVGVIALIQAMPGQKRG
jgi:hypothetical protein